MRIVTLVLAAALGCGAAAALAQAPAPLLPPDGAPPAPETRWSFKRVDDGFVRLDNKTGQVAHCTPRSVGWACQAVPEDRAALEKQIARLQDEVASLKKEIAALHAAPPAPPAAAGEGPGRVAADADPGGDRPRPRLSRRHAHRFLAPAGADDRAFPARRAA